MAAGLVDSFFCPWPGPWSCWGDPAARAPAPGLCSTAMLVGVALSAPIATWMAVTSWTAGGCCAGCRPIEGAIRLACSCLLAVDASVWLLSASW